jgi:hypothetical protein
LHRVFASADSLGCFAIQSMPFAVNRGQTDVVPLSFTFSQSVIEVRA